MENSAREARRRRILERGSDRLALITGQIQSIPPLPSSSSSSSQPHHSYSVSSPSVLYQDQGLQNHLSDQINVAPHDKDDTSSTALQKHESSMDSVRSAASGTRSRLEPQLRKCETSIDATKTPALDINSEVQPSLVSSTVKNSTGNNKQGPRAESRSHHTRFFTANQISSSISTSENIRIFGSITIALLVILSHLSIPLISNNILVSIIAVRPLYLVLLTDVTIVLAQILFWKQGGSVKAVEEPRGGVRSEDPYNWADVVGKAMETGLVLYKAVNAAFMDCSIYAVIVVCGLSLLRHWI